MGFAGKKMSDPMEMLRWSWDQMMLENKIWLYPIAVSLLGSLLITVSVMFLIPMFFFGPLFIIGTILWLLVVYGIGIVISVVVYFLMLISAKMFIQLEREGSADFERAKNEVVSAAGSYIIVGILAMILSIFIITIPLAITFVVYSVLYDPRDFGKNLDRGFKVIIDNLSHVIIFILLAIVAGILAGLAPAELSIITEPLGTFIQILVLGAFTKLVLEYESPQEESFEGGGVEA